MKISAELRSEFLVSMLRIRMIEEAIASHYQEQEMRCPVHLSIGQEASAVGVCAALRLTDLVFSGHRSHAHYLAKGGSLSRMLAELYGKETGCSSGRGGSMHLTDQSVGFIGATPIVGSTIPIAVGAALSATMKKSDTIVAVFFGDGAIESGVVHESLNFAALRKLPVLFICENNFYSVYSPMHVRQPSGRALTDIAKGHGVKSLTCNGNDVEEVFFSASEAANYARAANGPFFLELTTYRWREHCGPNYDDELGYRDHAEVTAWLARDPLVEASKQCPPALLQSIREKHAGEILEAFEFAKNSNFPNAAEAGLYVFR